MYKKHLYTESTVHRAIKYKENVTNK